MSFFSWLSRAARSACGHRYPFALCYHGVGRVDMALDRSRLFISTGMFEHHLELIAALGYELLTVAGLWKRLEGGFETPRVGAVSFDDALVRTAREALPALLSRGMQATIFVPTGLMGLPHPDMPSERILSASELRELADQGVEIGAHSVDHLWLPGLEENQILDQMRRSRAELEDAIGRPVTSMAYPYGGYDQRTIDAAAEAGFEVACGCSGPGAWNPYSLPRSPVFDSTTPLRLRLKMAGLYGPVHKLVADSGPIGRWRAADAGSQAQREPRRRPQERTI